MAIILHIDTATRDGSVCLAEDGRVLASRESDRQQDHAAVVDIFIRDVLSECGLDRPDAVAVSGGPGSYTGLRVAASTAKGLAYGWEVPLIAVPTLLMMAGGKRAAEAEPDAFLYCPVIDARRMDVFTGLYDARLHLIGTEGAVTLEEGFLEDYRDRPVQVFGTGTEKLEKLFSARKSWRFEPFRCHASQLVPFSAAAYREGRFEDPAYFEPFYLKAFYRPAAGG